ncbi:hypothetical protein MYX64_06505 [Nitrospinae bacterium AH_259_B05_G02_I21]|nr:hypothetical protein [Nitrospinae bacterium AH_259_B05_G02_I21]
MTHEPILEDANGVTNCTACKEPVKRLHWIAVEDFPELGVRVTAFPCEACEGTRVEARALPCEKEPA